MAPPSGQSPQAFEQLAAWLVLTLALILFASMGIVDGLKFRRIRVRYGVVVLSTFRGVPAQVIGGLCVLVELIGVACLVEYVSLLRRYCGTNVGCFITTPVLGLFAHWAAFLGTAMVLFCFIDWFRRRRAETTSASDDRPYSLPSVHRYVNDKLAMAGERPMNRAEVEQMMEFVEQHAPFVVLPRIKQFTDGGRLDPKKLARVFGTDERFRDRGQRTLIALDAVTEAYVATKQPPMAHSSRK